MRAVVRTFLLGLCALLGSEAFVVAPAGARPEVLSARPSLSESSFLSKPTCAVSIASAGEKVDVAPSRPRTTRGDLRMGKVAKFGVFSPAVVGAKIALGESRLNKIRGKAIALHSQVITEYCRWVGAPSKVRGLLIRKAKGNGDDLGFLW